MMNDVTEMTPEAMQEAGMLAMRQAEIERNKAYKRRKAIEREARRYLQVVEHAKLPWHKRLRTPVDDVEIDPRLLEVVVDSWASNDPKWKSAVANNRWYLSQAVAYGALGRESVESKLVPQPRFPSKRRKF